jgi:benzoate transport
MMGKGKTTNASKEHLIKDLISNRNMSAFQVFVVIMCFIMNMNDGIDVMVVSYTGSEILTEWALTKAQQGYIFSAGLAGMTLGCLLIAPLADRIGRRSLFILAMVMETIGMLLSYFVTAYPQLLVLRFIAGLGIGGLLPTMAAVASEFSSNKRKDLSVGFVQAGYPIGAIFMGFYTAWAVPEFGWRFGFLSAGVVSAVMLVMILFFMPESPEYLWKHQPKNALRKINHVLVKMGHEPLEALPEYKPVKKVNVRDIFNPEYRNSTILLWIGIFFGFMTLYTLISWVPSIGTDSGMPFKMATYMGTMLNIGAFVGSTGIGWLAARFNLRKLILTFYLIGFGIMAAYGNISLNYVLVFIITFFIGIFVQGGFNGYWPTTARVYETGVRTTGIGWATGAGRFGAIVGPALFGVLSDAGLSIATLFIIFSIPLVVSGIAAYLVPSPNLKQALSGQNG